MRFTGSDAVLVFGKCLFSDFVFTRCFIPVDKIVCIAFEGCLFFVWVEKLIEIAIFEKNYREFESLKNCNES